MPTPAQLNINKYKSTLHADLHLDRNKTMLEDRLVRHMTFRQIGKKHNCSAMTAHRVIQRLLRDPVKEDIDTLRFKEKARLDFYEALARDLVGDDGLKAIAEMRSISKERRALLGIDAPQKVEINHTIFEGYDLVVDEDEDSGTDNS